jgi:hypothetical protein
MTCAKRPLRWREIQAAASIEPDSQELRFDDQKFRFDIADLCGSLVHELPGKRLTLVHNTAKQYVLNSCIGNPTDLSSQIYPRDEVDYALRGRVLLNKSLSTVLDVSCVRLGPDRHIPVNHGE